MSTKKYARIHPSSIHRRAQADNIPGRFRPHRPARRSRIPQLQYVPSSIILAQLLSAYTSPLQTSTRSPPAEPPKSSPTANLSSQVPTPQPPPTAANTTSGPYPSTRKPSTSTPTKSCAAAHLPSTRAPISSTSSKEIPISMALCGSRRLSLSSCSLRELLINT
jgi:hypothetical protein